MDQATTEALVFIDCRAESEVGPGALYLEAVTVSAKREEWTQEDSFSDAVKRDAGTGMILFPSRRQTRAAA